MLIAGQIFYDGGPPEVEGESRELEAFLESGPAPVVFTLGSFVSRSGLEYYRACMEAASRAGFRAVLLGHRDDVAAMRENAPARMFIAPYVRHDALFPRAKIVVHHGGIGTAGQALRAGKPQLVTPFLGDQPDNAARLARLGLARVVDGRKVTAKVLARELLILNDVPDYARRAAEAARTIADEDGAAVAAREIGAVARRA